jgi:hypothetical protein
MGEDDKQAYLAAADASLIGHGRWANAQQHMTMLNNDVWETRIQREPNIYEQARVNNEPLLFFVFTLGCGSDTGGAALLREEPCPAIQTMAA